MAVTPVGTPAGPMNNNLFIDNKNSPAWSVDIPLESNPGLRGGPYVLALMDHPPLNIPLRAPTPAERRVRVVLMLTRCDYSLQIPFCRPSCTPFLIHTLNPLRVTVATHT
ncbi:uncharacterized protein F4817DRAFT_324012 [Daldinia loculata]|uniref:uncharacterized protein n=1 Tax=Daldinia loculata TaxID=103429 RepID=UPI0020C287C6|nr:uncharacterized protein F4817DRAFT_324012 [Daldinia loculata]KAI1651904.1 hypothetical protein F4817DRAFT_324012 [Daldinia loculata]